MSVPEFSDRLNPLPDDTFRQIASLLPTDSKGRGTIDEATARRRIDEARQEFLVIRELQLSLSNEEIRRKVAKQIDALKTSAESLLIAFTEMSPLAMARLTRWPQFVGVASDASALPSWAIDTGTFRNAEILIDAVECAPKILGLIDEEQAHEWPKGRQPYYHEHQLAYRLGDLWVDAGGVIEPSTDAKNFPRFHEFVKAVGQTIDPHFNGSSAAKVVAENFYKARTRDHPHASDDRPRRVSPRLRMEILAEDASKHAGITIEQARRVFETSGGVGLLSLLLDGSDLDASS